VPSASHHIHIPPLNLPIQPPDRCTLYDGFPKKEGRLTLDKKEKKEKKKKKGGQDADDWAGQGTDSS
jgi:hypothetical protein